MRATVLGFTLVSTLSAAASLVQMSQAADKDEAISAARAAQSGRAPAATVPQGSDPIAAPGTAPQIRTGGGEGKQIGPAATQPGVGVDVGDKVDVDVNTNPAGRAQQGERWRFRHHNGHWWYWLPRNRWVFWHNNRWVDYDQQSYSNYYPSNSNYYARPQGAGINAGPHRHGMGYRGPAGADGRLRNNPGVHIDAGGVDINIGGPAGGAIEERREKR